MDSRFGNSKSDDSVVPTVAGILIAVLVLVTITATVIGVIICRRLRKRSQQKMPTDSQVTSRIDHEAGDPNLSMSCERGSFMEKDVHLSANICMADEDLHLYGSAEGVILKTKLVATTQEMHQNRDRGFEEEFKLIKEYNNGSTDVACANRPKNRYGNIYTYDHSRVVLSVPDEDGSDYINASFIDGYHRENEYIAVQGPTSRTVGDFWQMIWDQKPTMIVMVTKVEENGKKKCEQYWNLELKDPLEVGEGLEVTTTANKGFADYEVSDITLINNSQPDLGPHKLKHFHYTSWPDHGVPSQPSSLMKFVQKVRREYKDDGTPMVVHCSAGVGRTGTFIAVDTMMERLKAGESDLNIHSFVMAMRSRRTFMVQTMEQYVFIHDTLCEYLTCGDTSVAAHDLMSVISDMRDIDKNTGEPQYYTTFEILGSLSKTPVAEDESYSKKVGISKKNRYKNKFLYAGSNIRIADRGPSHNADYINASFINGYSRKKAFIAAQAPLESTKNDVWEMIWQYRPSTVVVLCDFQKERQEACSRFWPDEREKTLNVGFLKVNNGCTERDTTYDITRLEVFDSRKESSKVLHVSLFHLKDWDKDGRPTTEAVLRLMGDVQNTTASPSGDVIPAVVMCDDGMGRSGVFICAMSEVERVKVEGQFDVFQTIKGMRIQRPHMVETADQYKLCFEILQSYLDSFDTYANFKAV
jgi:netrin-G3 ligand